jgi:hypothetical protein
MTTIQDHLCWYDPRNPSYTPQDCQDRAPRQPGCSCDPCFEGRDQLASRLMDAIKLLKYCLSLMDPHCTTQIRDLRSAIQRLEEPLS